MAYRVVLRPASQRQLAKLRGPLSIGLHGAIITLGGEPRPPGSIKLAGVRDLYRVRVRLSGESWRVIYQVDDAGQLVIVTHVRHRDEGTYREL